MHTKLNFWRCVYFRDMFYTTFENLSIKNQNKKKKREMSKSAHFAAKDVAS